jgi:threonine aldolase
LSTASDRRIDLRSDTVTHPTQAMREAMYRAEVGDDVLGDDPTVQRLEAMAAERLGKEAAVYVASGTMANLVSLLAHCERGEEAIVGSEAHIVHHEVAGAAGLGGIFVRTAQNDARGRIDPAEVRRMIRPRDLYMARTASSAWRTPITAAPAPPSPPARRQRWPRSPMRAAPPSTSMAPASSMPPPPWRPRRPPSPPRRTR